MPELFWKVIKFFQQIFSKGITMNIKDILNSKPFQKKRSSISYETEKESENEISGDFCSKTMFT